MRIFGHWIRWVRSGVEKCWRRQTPGAKKPRVRCLQELPTTNDGFALMPLQTQQTVCAPTQQLGFGQLPHYDLPIAVVHHRSRKGGCWGNEEYVVPMSATRSQGWQQLR